MYRPLVDRIRLSRSVPCVCGTGYPPPPPHPIQTDPTWSCDLWCMLGSHPPVDRMTDRWKNITLPQTSFADGKKIFPVTVKINMDDCFVGFFGVQCRSSVVRNTCSFETDVLQIKKNLRHSWLYFQTLLCRTLTRGAPEPRTSCFPSTYHYRWR